MITRNMALRMAVFIVCLSIIFPLCACEPHGYSGSDMDLYSVTHNSFPMTDYYETINADGHRCLWKGAVRISHKYGFVL